jgi:hypothetical protein
MGKVSHHAKRRIVHSGHVARHHDRKGGVGAGHRSSASHRRGVDLKVTEAAQAGRDSRPPISRHRRDRRRDLDSGEILHRPRNRVAGGLQRNLNCFGAKEDISQPRLAQDERVDRPCRSDANHQHNKKNDRRCQSPNHDVRLYIRVSLYQYSKQQSDVSLTYIKLAFLFRCDAFNASKHGHKSVAGMHNTIRGKSFI